MITICFYNEGADAPWLYAPDDSDLPALVRRLAGTSYYCEVVDSTMPESFFTGYLACALWSSTDDDDTPLDNGDYTVSDFALKQMRGSCQIFWERNKAILDAAISNYYPTRPRDNAAYGSAGHDFWLTRNHHGAGFWDGDWGPYGDALTDAAHAFLPNDPYVDDDKQIHLYYEGL